MNTTTTSSYPNVNVFGIAPEYHMTAGLFFALLAAAFAPITLIIYKKTQESKTHFSIINLYASYFGMPFTFLIISSFVLTGISTSITDYSKIVAPHFYWSLLYASLSALIGITLNY